MLRVIDTIVNKRCAEVSTLSSSLRDPSLTSKLLTDGVKRADCVCSNSGSDYAFSGNHVKGLHRKLPPPNFSLRLLASVPGGTRPIAKHDSTSTSFYLSPQFLSWSQTAVRLGFIVTTLAPSTSWTQTFNFSPSPTVFKIGGTASPTCPVLSACPDYLYLRP